jgi:NADH-quinone oxidoreductase subunit H
LIGKAMFGYWVIMWIRYTLMRVRIDHMLAFNWKFLTPLAFVLLMITALVHALLREGAPWIHTAGLLLANLLVAAIVVEILRRHGNRERLRSSRGVQPLPVSR